MKKNLFLQLLLLSSILSITLVSCDTIDPIIEEEDPLVATDPNIPVLVAADNDFGIDLFKRANAEKLDSNVFLSPFSVATALAMTYNGAESTTRQAMEETLRLSELSMEEVNATYENLLQLLENLDEEVLVSIANSIWVRNTFSPNPEFLNTNEVHFNSEVTNLDFTDPNAVDIINDWVMAKTNGKIEEIINKIPDVAVMYLINAIYFKGAWQTQFDPEDTWTDFPFQQENGETVNCDMMNLAEVDMPYFVGENFQAIDLAYGDSIWSMSIFVPQEGTSVNDLVEQLTTETWNTWTSNFQTTTLNLSMPKFTVEYKITLNDALKNMGMEIAFDEINADFSRLGPGQLFINRVLHKTFIEVTEEGTEAAAVTAVEIGNESAPLYPAVQLNRPFLYVIKERQHNTILFIGKMMNPVEE
ncbi:MAG: serpin family protein [Chitinophagales bacterium]